MKGIAISDSTCLIALCRIAHLDLLTETYESVLIPPEVEAEARKCNLDKILVRKVGNPRVIDSFPIRVHAGEAAAIALALETPDCEVILDDYRARQLAAMLGLRFIGTIGLILRAKFEGRLDAVRPIIDALREDGFRVSHGLLSQVLRTAGEKLP